MRRLPAAWQIWRQLRLTWRLLRDRRVQWPLKLIPLAAAAYALWPGDLIPDILTVLGLADDLALLALAQALFHRLVPPEIRADHLPPR
jgi:uncharacterized membrane protein YkvA (DUF1232 family)